ncbi:hypothetical protein GQ607_003772 [Colletotrichum asianum]|uniref:Uncharacterized protein n=1 Tax=Colletotrichum asianum TaxID=702518 RepID=A0A8H3WLH8_9PEZI|nr:hypothetical protein GQ607_003772 [Colletotrichum asianum]
MAVLFALFDANTCWDKLNGNINGNASGLVAQEEETGRSHSRPPFIGTHKAQPSTTQRRDPAQIRFQSAAPSSLAVALSRRDKLRVTSPQNSFPLTGPVSVRSPCHGSFACHATPCQRSPIEMCPLLHSMLV